MQEIDTLEKRDWAARLMAIAVAVFMVSSTFVLFAPEASARTGSDDYGFVFKDSNESDGPTYSWNEIVPGFGGTGTNIVSSSTDGGQGLYDLPFDFEFYENTYTTWGNGGDNGYITFGAVISNQWTPYHIPAAQLGGPAIAGGWFDGGFCRAGNQYAGVYYEYQGTTPNQKVVVTYQDQGHWYPSVYQCPSAAANNALTWQIIIEEATGSVLLQYKDTQGGYPTDNEWLTSGIQGKPGGALTGLEYVYRQSPSAVQDNTAVLFTPPPPLRNDLRLTSSTIPDPISLADDNVFGAEVTNAGVNCDVAGECSPVAETSIDVSASVFEVQETTTNYDFDDGDGGGFTSMSIQGTDSWTTSANDGAGNYNYGDEGAPDDGAWSSGRKTLSMGGMFSDNDKIHYDGTDILVANRGANEVVKIDASTHAKTTVLGPDTTYLRNVLDVTEDGTSYYTLSRLASLSSYTTYICKWSMDDGSMTVCNLSTVRYGIAIAHYDGEIFALQGGNIANAYRKVVILDASDLTNTANSVPYYQGLSYGFYASNMDVEDETGDVYIVYREFNGRVRGYERAVDGTYCAAAACHTDRNTLARYSSSIDVQDGQVYVNGYYWSSYYGGMRSFPTAGGVTTTMWSQFGQTGYKGSVAVTSGGEIWMATNYAFSYYNFQNFEDAIYIFDAGDTDGTAGTVLGPMPAMLTALSTPSYDLTSAIGATLEFKVSYQFYYRYEGAYMEASTDGGTSWSYIDNDHFTSGKYYGPVFVWYNTPISTSIDTWTYYNTNQLYTYMTHSAPWKTMKLNLDDYTGFSDVKFRWVVGFNTYNLVYYNSYFRLDDVSMTIKSAGTTYASETKTIDSLGFKESASVSFFDTPETAFRPSLEGLEVGSKLGILINVLDNGDDQDMSNNRAVAFREVKFVIFSDNFDDGEMGDWTTGKVKFGSTDWDVRNKDSTSGSYSMDSGYRTENTIPGDPYVSTPDLDLKLPVEAELQMMLSFYSYYLYDGYQMQISEDSGSSWAMITPTSTCGDSGGYPNIIYNYAYYGNPLRGQPGYTFYGTTNTMYSYTPDPQDWCKATFDLNPYVGQNDIRFRIVAGWSSIPTSLSLYESFFRFDDVAVTGLVYNDNVGISGLDLPDPIAINAVVPVGTTVINAGINAQAANAAKLRLQIGPLGIQTLDASDDLEGYANQAAAEAAGWSTDTECSDYAYSCGNWGAYAGDPGFVFNTDDGDGDETNSWGPDGGEFQMYYGGGTAEVQTGALDFTGAPGDMVLLLKHRYNWDYYGGYPSYNGGQVQISTDDGTTWEIFTPVSGYTGTMYNYIGYGNPLYNQPGFVHCGSCPGSKAAMDDADEYITTEFDMSDYVDMTDVRLKFVVGMYNYQWPGDGEHWYIDSLSFTGTGMESVAFEATVGITGSGIGGIFESGEAVDKVWNYHFQVPGAYKIIFDTWIGTTPSDGDDFLGDNQITAARETMFTVAGTTADGSALSKNNDALGQKFYDDDWMSIREGGPKDGYQWQPSASSASEMSHSPVWWAGNDAYGAPYDGDDTSLTSPVIDLSKATSAKLVFNHRFSFYGVEYPTYHYYYDGGRVEISTDGGSSWAGLPVTSGEMYRGDIYNYAYYGNPLSGQIAFAMSSSGGANFVESQCRLDDYVGAGFDNLKIRFHFGGAFPNWGSNWEIDDVGIYALGFDLAQTSASTPYTLEIGESAPITTSFINQGVGSLGAGGVVESASAKAYVNDMSGNELWSTSSTLGDLNMAYYDEMGNTFAGQSTGEIAFTFPGMDTAGMYTVGVKIADSTGATLADLFSANNDANHMLLVGMSADLGSPTLTGGENWAAVEGEPSDVGDGAMGVVWDETGVATDTLSVSIVGQAGGNSYSPSAPEAQIGTTVTWTNADTMTHTVTDKNAQFDSFDIEAGESWSLTFTEIGVFNYYCKYHPMMEGSITIVSSASADEQARTNYLQVWTAESYLVFWANFDMSDDSSISVIAQKKGSSLNDADSIGLWAANGFTIMDGSDHSEVGDSLTRSSGWNPYYIYLDSSRLGYNGLDYDPSDDNAYAFVFRARGLDGSAEIGGVQLIRTLDTGFFLTKDDSSQLTYEIFPSMAVEIDYFAKNIGTVDNTFRMAPELDVQGKAYDGAAFDISINVRMNGEAFDAITTFSNEDGIWTHEFDMAPDDEAMITVRFGAPDYCATNDGTCEYGEPAGNRKFDVVLNARDVGSGEDMREPVTATLFIKPSQFVLGEMSFNRLSVIEGETLDITVKAWNEGNYASDVLVVFYVMDTSGDAYSTPEGVKRMTRVASTTVDLMAPKPVLEDQGIYKTWYYATGTWDEVFIPGETVQDFDTVSVYAMINPDSEQQDLDAGYKIQDEYLNQRDDNDANGEIAVVKNKSSMPSFAVGILGMSIAALVAAVGASLRREEE